jgi:hypothetical protein
VGPDAVRDGGAVSECGTVSVGDLQSTDLDTSQYTLATFHSRATQTSYLRDGSVVSGQRMKLRKQQRQRQLAYEVLQSSRITTHQRSSERGGCQQHHQTLAATQRAPLRSFIGFGSPRGSRSLGSTRGGDR